MKTLLKLVSFAGLGLMIGSAIMVFNDPTTREIYLNLSLLGTVLWFISVPFWMKRRLGDSE